VLVGIQALVSGNGLFVSEIWRYPVKSMGGEKLDRAELTRSGVAGDRLVQVYSAAGRRVTARTHAGLLRFRARLGDGGASPLSTIGPGATLGCWPR
jgi:uncharacterized protein YcbX